MLPVERFIVVAEVEEAGALVQPLFDRRYRLQVPDFPLHVVAMHVAADGSSQVACYIHFTDCGDLLLSGGACTDNRVLRRMSAEERAALREHGGIFQYTVAWSARHFSSRFAAIFGYTGDTLTRRVIDALGWEHTEYPHLTVDWLQDVNERKKRQMVAKAHSFGAF
ncbi:MAG: hypothetical protein WCD66_03100 [Rhodanobacteraceae bacterium]